MIPFHQLSRYLHLARVIISITADYLTLAMNHCVNLNLSGLEQEAQQILMRRIKHYYRRHSYHKDDTKIFV